MAKEGRQPTVEHSPEEGSVVATTAQDCTALIERPSGRCTQDGGTAPTTPEQLTLSQRRLASMRDRAWLVVIAGTAVGQMHSLHEKVTLLGRSGGDATIAIDDPGVSRRHASIARSDDGGYLLEDLGSFNGTFIGGSPVTRHELVDGDRIGLGQGTVLKFALQDQLEEAFQKQLYESAIRDPLTHLFNRRHLMERLRSEIAFAKRHSSTLVLALVDIDHFKRVNDDHGHLAGDAVLRAIAQMLEKLVRTEDVVARYGGEELAIVARGIDRDSGRMLGERVRRGIEQLEIPLEGTPLRVTASVGVGFLGSGDEIGTPEDLVAHADERLYEAKRSGRNRTCS